MSMLTELQQTATPYAAAYVLLRDGNKLAFLLRTNTGWMNGYYSLPSGKVEKGESPSAAAIREVKEEAGVVIKLQHIHHVITTHRRSDDNSEWVDVYFEVDNWEGEVINAEPDIHGELAWFDINNLPKNVVPSVRFTLQQLAQGNSYAEFGWDG